MEETDAERRTSFSQEQRRNSRQQKIHHSRKEKDSDVLSREDGELSESVGEGTETRPGRSRHNARAISARGFSRSRSRTSLRREIKDSQPAHSPARIDRHRGEQGNPKGQQPKHMGSRQREIQADSPENHSRNRERRGSPIRVSPPITRRTMQRNRSRSDAPHDRRRRKQQQSSYQQDLNYPSGRERKTRSRSRSREKIAPTDDVHRHIRSCSRVRDRRYPQQRDRRRTPESKRFINRRNSPGTRVSGRNRRSYRERGSSYGVNRPGYTSPADRRRSREVDSRRHG